MILQNENTLRVQRNRIGLLDGDSLHLRKHAGAELRVDSAVASGATRGLLWITEEGELDDVFLRPGERYRMRGQGRVVATAWGDLQLRLLSARDVAREEREEREARQRDRMPQVPRQPTAGLGCGGALGAAR